MMRLSATLLLAAALACAATAGAAQATCAERRAACLTICPPAAGPAKFDCKESAGGEVAVSCSCSVTSGGDSGGGGGGAAGPLPGDRQASTSAERSTTAADSEPQPAGSAAAGLKVRWLLQAVPGGARAAPCLPLPAAAFPSPPD